MAARLLALVAAVVMVVGSIAVRSRLDDEGAGNGGGDRGRVLHLVCSSELGDACTDLAQRSDGAVRVTVEPAGVTAGRLAKEEAGGPGASLDGWLVPAPWPDIVDSARRSSGLAPLPRPGPVLARSPLVLAAWPDRAGVLRSRCPGGEVGWRCWGDAAGQPWAALGGRPEWGQVKPGHAPAHEAVGLLALGAATAAFFNNDPGVAPIDVQEADAYRGWLNRLEQAVPTFRPAGTPLRDMLLKGPVTFDVVATTEAEAGPLVVASPRREKPVVIYPSPVATVDVVLVPAPGDGPQRLVRTVEGGDGREALARGGWRVSGRPRAAGVPPGPELPPSNGLPGPDVLVVLRSLVPPVTR